MLGFVHGRIIDGERWIAERLVEHDQRRQHRKQACETYERIRVDHASIVTSETLV